MQGTYGNLCSDADTVHFRILMVGNPSPTGDKSSDDASFMYVLRGVWRQARRKYGSGCDCPFDLGSDLFDGL